MTIRKLPGQNKWRVLGEKTGRNMGTYRTKAEATKRLKQVEFFKRRAQWRR